MDGKSFHAEVAAISDESSCMFLEPESRTHLSVSRRGSFAPQAVIARILRAYRSQGMRARILLMRDGSTVFEPVEEGEKAVSDNSAAANKEIVL
jgi:hypothetical protein